MPKFLISSNPNAFLVRPEFQNSLSKDYGSEALIEDKEIIDGVIEIREKETGIKINKFNEVDGVERIWIINLEAEIKGIASKNLSKTAEKAILVLRKEKEKKYTLHVLLVELKKSLNNGVLKGERERPAKSIVQENDPVINVCEIYNKELKEYLEELKKVKGLNRATVVGLLKKFDNAMKEIEKVSIANKNSKNKLAPKDIESTLKECEEKFLAGMNRLYMLLTLNNHSNPEKGFEGIDIELRFKGLVFYFNGGTDKYVDALDMDKILKSESKKGKMMLETIIDDRDVMEVEFVKTKTEFDDVFELKNLLK